MKKILFILFLIPFLYGCNGAVEQQNALLKEKVRVLTEQNDSLKLTSPVMFGAAIDLIKEERFTRAENVLNEIIAKFPSSPEAGNAKLKLKQIKVDKATYLANQKIKAIQNAKEEKKQRLNEIAESAATRADYAKTLRTTYLDRNLDIEVSVFGKYKEKLKLTYALFNDVWLRKMETNGNLTEWHNMGFQEVTLSDGYDYNQVVTWKN